MVTVDQSQIRANSPVTDNRSLGREVGQSTPVQQGTLKGESVSRIAHPLSLFESALEELTFITALNKKDPNNRRIQEHQRGKGYIDQIEAFLKNVTDADKQRLNSFDANLLKQNISSYPQLLAYLQSLFQDVSLQYLAMTSAREKLRKEHRRRLRRGGMGLGALLALLDDSIERLEAEQGPEIRAGINVSPVAIAAEQSGLGGVQSLRDFYRDAVLDYQGLSDTYRKVVAEYGNQDLPQAIGFLLQGLGADLTAQGSSIDRILLRQIVADMQKLKVVNSVYARAIALFQQVGL